MSLLGRLLLGLFASDASGGVSLSKTMKLIGFVVVTYIIILQAHRDTLSVDIFLTYFGLIIGNDQIGKWQSIRRERIQLEAGSDPRGGSSDSRDG